MGENMKANETVEKKEDAVVTTSVEGGLSNGDRKILYAILAISMLSLMIGLYTLYALSSQPGAVLPPPANWSFR